MFVLSSKDKESINTMTPESTDIFPHCLCDGGGHELMKNALVTEGNINYNTEMLQYFRSYIKIK